MSSRSGFIRRCALLMFLGWLLSSATLQSLSSTSEEFSRLWYGRELKQMGEANIGQLRGTRVYRFLLLTAFGPQTCVRIQATGDRYKVTTVITTAPARVGSKVISRSTVSLAGNRVKPLLDILSSSQFWIPAKQSDSKSRFAATDADRWVFESLQDGEHKIIDLDASNEKNRMLARQYFLDLADIHHTET